MFSTVEVAAVAHCVPDTGLQERVRLLCLAASQFQPHQLCSGNPPELKPVETLQKGRSSEEDGDSQRTADGTERRCAHSGVLYLQRLS